MSDDLRALLFSWDLEAWVVVPLLLSAVVYAAGCASLRPEVSARTHPRRVQLAFYAGLAVLFVALESPFDGLNGELLLLHMEQHILLMMVAPPLLLFGAPTVPLVRGWPRGVRARAIGPLVRSIGRALRPLARPPLAFLVYVGTLWTWHAPRLYEAALASEGVHDLEHLTFFFGGLLFWWPVVAPYPHKRRAHPLGLLLYLFLANIQGEVLAAVLASRHLLYPSYAAAHRLFGLSALEDQHLSAALMWLDGMMMYFAAFLWVASRFLRRRGAAGAQPPSSMAPVSSAGSRGGESQSV